MKLRVSRNLQNDQLNTFILLSLNPLKLHKKWNQKNAIMTHFSQKYLKIPPLEEFEVANNVGIAFDFTTVAPNNS